MLSHDTLAYEKETLAQEHKTLYSTLISDDGGLLFLYGYGGTGKTFVWKILAEAIRSRGEIVINVISSSILALLLIGGRTAHSRFSIPINLTEDSFCSIAPNNDLAALLNRAKVIIWDEAPMLHKHCFEAFDRTIRDIIHSPNRSKSFGGKVIVFGGDFHQILPIIPKGSRAKIVHASLHSSHLWRHCKVLRLTKNMSFFSSFNVEELQKIKEFDRMDFIGGGKFNEPNDDEADVEFPQDVLLESDGNHIRTIVNSIYPSFTNHLSDPVYFQDKAILIPTNEEIDSINEHVLSKISNDEHV